MLFISIYIIIYHFFSIMKLKIKNTNVSTLSKQNKKSVVKHHKVEWPRSSQYCELEPMFTWVRQHSWTEVWATAEQAERRVSPECNGWLPKSEKISVKKSKACKQYASKVHWSIYVIEVTGFKKNLIELVNSFSKLIFNYFNSFNS